MKKVFVFLLATIIIKTGCTSVPLELEDITVSNTSHSVISNESFESLSSDMIETFIEHDQVMTFTFNKRVNDCQVNVFLLDNSLNVLRENYSYTLQPVLTGKKVETKMFIGGVFNLASDFAYYDDKYCGIQLVVDNEKYYTAFKIKNK